MKATLQSTVPDTLPPHNVEAEEAILGGVMLDPNALARVTTLPSEAFFLHSHQLIFEAALELHRRDLPGDLIAVHNYLSAQGQLEEVGGLANLVHLANTTVTTVNIDYYAELVRGKWVRRRAIALGNEIAAMASDQTQDYLSALEEKLAPLRAYRDGVDENYQRYRRMVDRIREIERASCDPGYKHHQLYQLSREYQIPLKQLQAIYQKSLLHDYMEQPMTWSEFRSRYGGEVRSWLLHGLLPQGSVVMLHAPGGCGKTRFAYHVAYHVATGQPWNGFQVIASKRRCLILQTDEPPGDALQVLEDLGFDETLEVRFSSRFQMDNLPQLRQIIEDFRPDFIIGDSITSMSRNSMFTENDTEYARPILELRDLAQEYGCTILLIHHSNANGDSRGTRAIYNSVSEVWKLERPDQNATSLQRFLTIEKSRSRAPAKYRLEYEPENCSWLMVGEEPEDENRTFKDQIVAHLSQNRGVRFEAEELSHLTGAAEGHTRRICRELADKGEVSRVRLQSQGRPYAYFIAGEDDSIGRSQTELAKESSAGEGSGVYDRRSPESAQPAAAAESEKLEPPRSAIVDSEPEPEVVAVAEFQGEEVCDRLPERVEVVEAEAIAKPDENEAIWERIAEEMENPEAENASEGDRPFQVGQQVQYVGYVLDERSPYRQGMEMTVIEADCLFGRYICQRDDGERTSWINSEDLVAM